MAKVTIGGRAYEVEVRGETVVVDGHDFPIKLREDQGYTTVTANGVGYRVQLPIESGRQSGMAIAVDYRPFTVEWDGRMGSGPVPRAAKPSSGGAQAAGASAKGGVAALIAGRVMSIKVKAGEAVKRGDVLLLLEAMKMENEIKAPADCTVKEVLVAEGARVAEGETLVIVE